MRTLPATSRARGPILLLLALSALCCRDSSRPNSTTSPPEPESTPAPPTVRETAQVTGSEALVAELRRHGGCTRLNDCPPARALVRLGRQSVGAIAAAAQNGRDDRFWRVQALDTLGRLGGEEAERFLLDRLSDPDERLGADVILALGHMRSEAAREPVSALIMGDEALYSPELRLAGHYLLARLGDEKALESLRAKLTPAFMENLPPSAMFTALTVIRWLNDRGLTETIFSALSRSNIHVKRVALRLIHDWRLREAAPYLIALLDDDSSGVRREAAKTLTHVTGRRHLHTSEQWLRWCRGEGLCPIGH